MVYPASTLNNVIFSADVGFIIEMLLLSLAFKYVVPLYVGENDEVELKLVNLPDTPLIAAEDTLVAADKVVADIVIARDEVELKSVNLALGEETVVALRFPARKFVRAEIFVPLIVRAKAEVELKSVNLAVGDETVVEDNDVVNLASGEETVVALRFPARRFVRAEIFVPLIVRAKAEVELKSVNLAVGELTVVEDSDVVNLAVGDETVVEDSDVVNLASGEETVVELKLFALTSPAEEILAAEREVVNLASGEDTVVALKFPARRFVKEDILVAEIFCINAEGADTEDNALILLAMAEVPDKVTP
jgi:hypothetical protein